jgi:HAD superfamily hydrolase (TIGR01549 family)
MERPAPRAIVFDLDGTLLDSLPLVLRAFGHALEPFAERPTMDIFARLGGPPAKVFNDLLGGESNVAAALERLTEFNRDNGHLIRPFDGIGDRLEELRRRSAELAVWTGRDRETTLALMNEHGLTGYFREVVCGDDLMSHKPDPEGLIEILRRLGAVPSEALLVGDADVDVRGGAACGVETILIRNGRTIDAAVQELAWRTVDSPADAFAAVLSRFSAPSENTVEG